MGNATSTIHETATTTPAAAESGVYVAAAKPQTDDARRGARSCRLFGHALKSIGLRSQLEYLQEDARVLDLLVRYSRTSQDRDFAECAEVAANTLWSRIEFLKREVAAAEDSASFDAYDRETVK